MMEGTGGYPHAWEIRLAWILRIVIVITAVVHVVQGKLAFALLCFATIAVLVAPPLLARTSRANVPVELELAALWGAVSDMTLGRLAGLYAGTIWYDKVLHFGNSLLVGLLAFLCVYALRFTGRLQAASTASAIIIVLLALGVGALWEIAEYVADLTFAKGAQGSPALPPLDDTMWDLILDGIGGALGGLVGAVYMRRSRRSAQRALAFARLVPRNNRTRRPQGRQP